MTMFSQASGALFRPGVNMRPLESKRISGHVPLDTVSSFQIVSYPFEEMRRRFGLLKKKRCGPLPEGKYIIATPIIPAGKPLTYIYFIFVVVFDEKCVSNWLCFSSSSVYTTYKKKPQKKNTTPVWTMDSLWTLANQLLALSF